jgi:peroxiredoxin
MNLNDESQRASRYTARKGSLIVTVGAKLPSLIAIHPEEGVAYRATFVIDPDNVIQQVTVNGLITAVTQLKH